MRHVICTAIALLWTVTAVAEPYPECAVGVDTITRGGDTFCLERVSDSLVILHYGNDQAQDSSQGMVTLQSGDLIIKVWVEVRGPETVRPLVPEPWISVPPEIDVLDGETAAFQIMLPMF